jgi:hypothetical protein
MAFLGFIDVLLFGLFKTELYGGIPVGLVGFDLRNNARTSGKQGNSSRSTVICDGAGHAYLSGN